MKILISLFLFCSMAIAKDPNLKEKREESYDCQKEKLQEVPGKLVLPVNTCKCNKQVRLPVYQGCKKYEPRKG